MESIDRIFNIHINPSILITKPINNAMLDGIAFFDPMVLSVRLSRIYHDIFALHDWNPIGYGRFRHALKDILVEVHNKYNTFNSKDKTHNLNSLRRLKSQTRELEIIYGCIMDRIPKDEPLFSNGNVRLITGERFLHFMLGDKAEPVQERLKYFIDRFYRNDLTPWLRRLRQMD